MFKQSVVAVKISLTFITQLIYIYTPMTIFFYWQLEQMPPKIKNLVFQLSVYDSLVRTIWTLFDLNILATVAVQHFVVENARISWATSAKSENSVKTSYLRIILRTHFS
jgi:hypothetical protein